MKKAICIMLAVALMLSFAGCGKSEAVKAAENAIANIGEVTLQSEEAIQQAQKCFDILTEEEKAQVENRMTLADAKEAFEKAVADYKETVRLKNLESLKEVYIPLKEASEIVDHYGSDLIAAYNEGHNNTYKFKGTNLNGATRYLSTKLYLSYDDVLEGECYAYYVNWLSGDWNKDWLSKTEQERKDRRSAIATGTLFYMNSKAIEGACLATVIGAYRANGDVEKVEECAKQCETVYTGLKNEENLSEEITQLEGMTNSIRGFLELCDDPQGSLKEVEAAMNIFRKLIEDKITVLDSMLLNN